jgi:hypothetical protein
MSDLLPRTIGDLIAELGEARETGRITHDDAVTQLLAADPTLHALGAAGQLAAWRTAAARYAALTAPRRSTHTAVDARATGARTPIVIRFPRQATS